MRRAFAAAHTVLLVGAIGIGCNSLVGNDTHELAPPSGMGGGFGTVGGAKGGFGQAGGNAGGGPTPAGGSAVASGGVSSEGGTTAAGGGPAAGGAVGTGGAATGGAVAAGGNAPGGRSGSGGVVATGGVTGAGGVPGSGGMVATGGAGTAGAGGMCLAPGSACTASSACCQTGSTTPMGAVCISDDGVCHAKCMAAGDCVSGCCAAVTGETYGVCADASFCATLKGVGDPCTANSECASGSCSDWCQASCGAGNSTCSSTSTSVFNAEGEANWCVFTQASTYSCFPGCVVNSDCAVYGASYTCQQVTDVDGLTDSVCSL